MYGGAPSVQVNPIPTPPSPWRDLLAAAHNVQLPIADSMLEADIVARLDDTPFMSVPSGITLPQLREIGYCALWAHDCLIDQAAWDSLTVQMQGELQAHIGFSAALAPVSATDGCIAVCKSWREATAQPIPTVQAVVTPPIPGAQLRGQSLATTTLAEGVVLPQRVAGDVAVGGDDAWWIDTSISMSSGSKLEWSGFAQNNILSPYHLGDASCMGSSAWEPVCTGVHGALAAAVSSGVGSSDTKERKADLQAKILSLKVTTQFADLLLSGKEAAELKVGRKTESATRRRITPSLSTYPWCQSFGVGEGMVAGNDAASLGRQLAVALRADGSASVSDLDEVVRQSRASKFRAIFDQFDVAWTSENAVGVLLALEAYKIAVRDTLTVSFNDALSAATTYPDSILLREVCAGRSQQLKLLHTVWDQLSGKSVFGGSLGVASTHPDRQLQFTMGAAKCLFDGARTSTSVAATMQATYEAGGSMFSVPSGVAVASRVHGAAPIATGCGSGGGSTTVSVARGGSAPTAAPPSTKTKRTRDVVIQVHMPVLADIIGTKIGLAGPLLPCWSCQKKGHSQGECPLAYGKLGIALPGWDLKGNKVSGEWNPNEPKRATYKAWVALFQDTTAFPSGQAEHSGVRSAPPLGHFQERADHART
jgi:hypothetical protein